MEEEIWKDIEGYEGSYQVSTKGRVKSLDRVVSAGRNATKSIKGKMLKPDIGAGGYVKVVLCSGGVLKNKTIHRLVAMAFIPNPDNKPNINHIDCNRKNNDLSNLEWVTQLENIRHAVLNNRLTTEKAVSMLDVNGDFIKAYKSASDASRKLNGNSNGITAATRGRYITSCGCYWRYATNEEIETIE